MDRGRESQDSNAACSSMSERDGKDQREGSPKQARSCWVCSPLLVISLSGVAAAILHISGVDLFR